jgi:hypothetical protein
VATPVSAQVLELSPTGELSIRTGAGEAVWRPVDDVSGTKSAETTGVEVPGFSTGNPVSVPQQYSAIFQEAASQADISPALLAALVWQESRWNAAAVSRKGAIGLTQLMPGTAGELGVDPRDPAANLRGGAKYLRQLLDQFDGDVEMALAAYNAGPNRVRRANGIPRIPETQQYVGSIIRHLSNMSVGGIQ